MIRRKKSGQRYAGAKQASADKALAGYTVRELTHVPMVHARKGVALRVAAVPALVEMYLKRGFRIQ